MDASLRVKHPLSMDVVLKNGILDFFFIFKGILRKFMVFNSVSLTYRTVFGL